MIRRNNTNDQGLKFTYICNLLGVNYCVKNLLNTVVSGRIHTCYLVNCCLDEKVTWVVFAFFIIRRGKHGKTHTCVKR